MRTNDIYSADHGAFLHACPNCGKEFTGRRNQVYCRIKCKVDYGNEIARQRREELIASKSQMSKNLRIARRLLKQEEFAAPSISELEQLGFDITGPFNRVSVADNRQVYRIGEDYFIEFDRNTPTDVVIYRESKVKTFEKKHKRILHGITPSFSP